MNPLISVVIPLYNKENSIRTTVQSLLVQDFKSFEIVIINDGSTDRSLEKIENIKDDRIKIITKVNGGVSRARNFGVKHSMGKFIFFLDADDIVTKNCLSVFSDLVNKYTDTLIFTANFDVIYPDGCRRTYCKGKLENRLRNPIKYLWERKIFPRTGSMLICRTCFDEVGFFRTDITVYEDLEFIIRLLKLYAVVYTPEIVLTYQCEFNSLSQNKFPLSKEFAYYINLSKKSFYERFVLAENIYLSIQKRRRFKDYEAVKYLLHRNIRFLLVIIMSPFYRKILSVKYKLFSI